MQLHELSCDSSLEATAWFLSGQLGVEGERSHVAITESPFVIGRQPDAALCLPFRTVSGKHAKLSIDHDLMVLEDLNSTNGTYLNGKRVEGKVNVNCDDLVQFADIPLRVCRQKSENLRTQTIAEDVYEQAIALVQFDKLMSERRVTPYYQPIVDLETTETLGYEVLGRSPLFGVSTPAAMFRAAEKMNLEVPLSRMLRWEGIHRSSDFPTRPHLFVNTHPLELAQPGLVDSIKAVRDVIPDQPLTLEIHEAAVTDNHYMTDLRVALNDLNVTLAYDDFGEGRARLGELVKVRPEYLKFDISLIRDIHTASVQHQQMVGALVRIASDLGIIPLAEGVEQKEEGETCLQLGFRLAQGYFFGRPAPATPGE